MTSDSGPSVGKPLQKKPDSSKGSAVNKNAERSSPSAITTSDDKRAWSKALTISVAEFEKEMEAIKANGFTVIPMQDFLAWRRGESDNPQQMRDHHHR